MTTAHTSDSKEQRGSRSPVPPDVPDSGPFTNILCAVHGTWRSMEAVKVAASLAGPDGHLTLLAATGSSRSGRDAMAVIGKSRAKRILSQAERTADRAGVSSSTVVDPAIPPVDAILERASDHDLLVIGSPATAWLGGMFLARMSSWLGGMLGGVTAAALGRLTTPLLVVRRPSDSLRSRTILVASDGGEGSDRIVELAGKLARSEGARVTLVNALGAESKMNPRAIQDQAQALKDMLPDACEPIIEPGNGSEVILGAAKSTKAAMVLIGSRRLSGVRAFGSVSRRVVHGAPCSVLVVPPAEDQASHGPEET